MIGVGPAAAHAVTHLRTTRNLLIVAAVIILFVPVILVAVPVTLVLATGPNGFGGRRVCGGSAPTVEAGTMVDSQRSRYVRARNSTTWWSLV
jgi:hypothetical protein